MPRLPPKWPPMCETTSMIVSRISWATCGSCLRSSLRRSRGDSIESSSRGMMVVSRALGSALADVTRNRAEVIHRAGDHISVLLGHPEQAFHFRPCTLHAQKRGEGQFSLGDVLSGGLT